MKSLGDLLLRLFVITVAVTTIVAIINLLFIPPDSSPDIPIVVEGLDTVGAFGGTDTLFSKVVRIYPDPESGDSLVIKLQSEPTKAGGWRIFATCRKAERGIR